MGKLFIRVAGSISETAVNLENILLELNTENITFTNTVEIKKKLNKIEQQLNKITNSIQNSTFSDLEKDKLQTAFNLELQKLETIKNKLKELQKNINSDSYCKERDRLCKLLKKFNSHVETFSEYFKDTNKNKELLVQLNIFKKHIKDATICDNVTVIDPNVQDHLNQPLENHQSQNSQSKLALL